jgi:hypothetical protein
MAKSGKVDGYYMKLFGQHNELSVPVTTGIIANPMDQEDALASIAVCLVDTDSPIEHRLIDTLLVHLHRLRYNSECKEWQ